MKFITIAWLNLLMIVCQVPHLSMGRYIFGALIAVTILLVWGERR